MARMSVPCIRPSRSTCVYRNSPAYGSSARTASDGVSWQHRSPAVDDDASAAAVDGGDEAVGADGAGELLREARYRRRPFWKSDDARMTPVRAEADERARPRRSADAAADAAREPRADRGDERARCAPAFMAASRSIS